MNYIIVPAMLRINKHVSLMFNLSIFLSLLGVPAKVRKAIVRHVCPSVCIEQQSANWEQYDNLKRGEFGTVRVRKPNASQ